MKKIEKLFFAKYFATLSCFFFPKTKTQKRGFFIEEEEKRDKKDWKNESKLKRNNCRENSKITTSFRAPKPFQFIFQFYFLFGILFTKFSVDQFFSVSSLCCPLRKENEEVVLTAYLKRNGAGKRKMKEKRLENKSSTEEKGGVENNQTISQLYS